MNNLNYKHVFHHIPKCGGSSVNKVIKTWFEQIREYRSGFNEDYPETIDIDKMSSNQCLCGHWELDGFYLTQRYPGILDRKDVRVLSFIRDPLSTRLSLYRFETKYNNTNINDHIKHISAKPNWMANRFPVTYENYQSIVDKYFFIGILEQGQISLDILAKLLGKRPVMIPHENRTEMGNESNLPDDAIEEFKEKNKLDYLLYDYCLEKLERTKKMLTDN